MAPKRDSDPPAKQPDFSGMPEFARAVRGLAHTPKAEVDAAIAKERSAKKRMTKRK
jgi:hypothetical protein